jgi:hypothetical protein
LAAPEYDGSGNLSRRLSPGAAKDLERLNRATRHSTEMLLPENDATRPLHIRPQMCPHDECVTKQASLIQEGTKTDVHTQKNGASSTAKEIGGY